MSERASFQVSGGTGGGSFKIARLEGTEAVWQELTEDERKAYTPPPTDKYHLKVVGISEPWKEPKKVEWIKRDDEGNIIGPTETLMTSLEFEIMAGKGKGKKFASRIPCSIYESSNLGKVWTAAGLPIQDKELMNLLGREVEIYVEKNPGVDRSGNAVNYANPTWSTAKPVGASNAEDDGWETE